jgi:hypothetical protein
MRFDTNVHEAYCGIDLQARTMYVCIFNRDGELMLHRNLQLCNIDWSPIPSPKCLNLKGLLS